MLFMLLTGSLNTLILKFQNSSASDVDGKHYEKWTHPFAQSVFMFLGEAGCFIVYIFMRYKDKLKYGDPDKAPAILEAVKSGKRTNINPWLLLVPSLFDNMSSSLMFIALGFIPASVY